MVPSQPRLGVEGVDLRRAAGHEEEDHPPRPGREMRRAGRQGIGRRSVGGCLVGQERRQGQRAEAGTRPPQHLAAARQGSWSHRRSIIATPVRPAAGARPAISVDVEKLVLANDQLAIPFPRIDACRRRPATASPARSRPATAAGPGRGRRAGGCGAVGASGSSRPIRAARARAISLTNGSFRKKRACGATTDSPRSRDDRAGIGPIEQAAEVGRPGPGADGLKIQRPPGHGQVRERGPAACGVEPAGHGQQAVADRFRLEPPAVHPPEQAIVRVSGQRVRRRRGCSAGRPTTA